MIEARFQGRVMARSDRTRVVEGNHYFPLADVRDGVLQPSRTKTLCFWKGVASYFTVEVEGVRAQDAAWSYLRPSPFARRITDHVAFWGAVQVAPAPEP